MAALPLIAGDMLGRRPSGLTGKLRQARLMHAMPARGIDADRPDMVQALDQAEHRGRLCRLRHLAKPDKPALPAFRPALRQRIELPPLLGGKADRSAGARSPAAPESGDRCRGVRGAAAPERRSAAGGIPP